MVIANSRPKEKGGRAREMRDAKCDREDGRLVIVKPSR
eukprot:CAMPEP_0181124802 /NCGR_PEP_ID=MMETSP1071-20121207/26687_1 /TAXON_ID=35127 /ORGANISM="Thalassiosira sp., Strain NH16" /LENGTH=37 /DNA_ID= /DNA_START= /DNA_END= /DNA_ORIENTATION=